MYQPNFYSQQQSYTPMRQVPQYLKGRPVSSFEEVRAASIDFDGSIFYFPDLANKRIYTKQINMDGTATFNMYELQAIPVETPVSNSTNFITRQEFEEALAQLRQSLTAQQPQGAENPTKEATPLKLEF